MPETTKKKEPTNIRLRAWGNGDCETITDTQLRLNCIDLATRCANSHSSVVKLAEEIYAFVVNE